jgi:hypothetical protein
MNLSYFYPLGGEVVEPPIKAAEADSPQGNREAAEGEHIFSESNMV